MKNNFTYILYKIVWVWLSFQAMTLLSASEDIAYSFHINNQNPYRNEAIILDVNLTQKEHSKVMLFNFKLKKNSAYTFHQIKFKENEEYHDLEQYYQYLIYPKKEGKIFIEFKMIQSLTDDDKVAYAISGDRDNVKGLVKEDIIVPLNPLPLIVKSLPPKTELVGDFKLHYSLDKKRLEAYEPLHLKVTIEGKGDVSDFSLYSKDKHYHLFTQSPKIQKNYTADGIKSLIEWDYAFSAKEDFVLEKLELHVFNPNLEKSYILTIPAQKIEVVDVNTSLLLDKEDNPPPSIPFDWSWLWSFLSYSIVFFAGYFTPKEFWNIRKEESKSEEEIFREKVQQTQNHKELLQLLLSENALKYHEAIEKLERVIYYREKMPLREIKLNIGTV